MRRALIGGIAVVIVIAVVMSLRVRRASAHCDTMDGPVVMAARQALESGNISHVLPWVSAQEEPEIRAAFEHTRRVRGLGPEAKDLADTYFFETLVRVHRAGEGAPYTGLKPAGGEVNPAVEAADRAFETGSSDALVALLTDTVRKGVATRFAEAKAAQGKDINDIAARRRGVHSYVEFVHYVERIYDSAAGAPGDAEATHGQVQRH